MRKTLTGSIALVAFASVGVAGAADLPVKVPIAPAPAYSWTNCYIGFSAGGIWRPQSNQSSGPNVSIVDGGGTGAAAAVAAGAIPTDFNYGSSASILAGGQLGCNYQFAPYWVVGVETDLAGTRFDAGQTLNTAVTGFPALTTSVSESMTWIGTTRGRLGWAQGNVLIYATGGAAYANINRAYTLNNIAGGGTLNVTAADSSTQFGWTAGGGAELALGRWTVRGEYLFYDLRDHVLSAPNPIAPATVYSVHFHDTGSLIRLGLNYRFGWDSPVVARY
jgi:outer membrane immunogenic protein